MIKKLGHGGDGTIYLVRHCPTEQLRAAKLLKADTQGRRRHELDMMKHLRHSALPQIYDVLEEQGNLWIIMEFIVGKTLSELCEEEKIGALRFFSVASQLAEALVYLHTRKPPVLHLDIKPSNIMIQPDGTVVLIDFGAAVHADAKAGKSACFGTPGFAAPEQWDPNTEPDARADFYGFGAVLYYCLYGSVPGVPDGIRKRNLRGSGLQKKVVRGEKRAGNIAERICWRREAASLVRRCMQQDRDRRFPDTEALQHSVNRAERRYYARKKLCRSSAAALLLLATADFAAVNLQWNDPEEAMAAQAQHSYDMLLNQADGLGFEQAVICYGEAAGLCPTDGAWCDRLLERIESDYTFSLEEEAALKGLMFSVPSGGAGTEEELLEAGSPEYGNLAYRIGLMYWYCYEGSGGKSAATKWFARAVAWQEEQDRSGQGKSPDGAEEMTETEETGTTQEITPAEKSDAATWLESARIHAKIGSYYETLGKQNPDGGESTQIRTYWEDMAGLWHLDSLGQESLRIRCEVARELLSVLVMQSSELVKEGIGPEHLQETLLSIELFLSDNPESEEIMKDCWEQYQAAWEAVERLTENERGNELGTEKKEQG